MPDFDGWSVLKKLKSDPVLAEIPVIIVTIVDNEPMGLDLGAASYLIKPVDRDRLAVLVEKYRMARSAGVDRSHTTSSLAGAKKPKRQTELKLTGDVHHADDLVGRRQ
jgi:CheY-like chemotaxis protein